jgi:hypothetical protein
VSAGGRWVHRFAAIPDRPGDAGRFLVSNLTVNTVDGQGSACRAPNGEHFHSSTCPAVLRQHRMLNL